MARTPNFSFERQERERAKARKVSDKAEAKRLARVAQKPLPKSSDEDVEG